MNYCWTNLCLFLDVCSEDNRSRSSCTRNSWRDSAPAGKAVLSRARFPQFSVQCSFSQKLQCLQEKLIVTSWVFYMAYRLEELKNAKILERGISERATRFFHFELKTSLLMKINSHCWIRIALQRLQCIFIIVWKSSNKHRTAAAALIRGWRLLTFPLNPLTSNWPYIAS